MSEVVTQMGSTTTDAAAEAIDALLGGVVEENDEAEAEIEEVEAESVEEAEDEAPEEDEDEPFELTTVAALAELLGVDEETLSAIQTTVKVQGETQNVTLSELTTGYQKGSDYARNVEALKREREQFEQDRVQRLQAFEQDHAQNAMIVQALEQSIRQQLDSEEMAQLRHTNQNEWLARRYDLQDRLNGIQQLKQDAGTRYQAMQAQLMQEQQAQLTEMLEKQRDLLTHAIPTWGADTQQSLNKYLGENYGYSPQELQAITDHRAVVIANKARLWDEAQASAQTTSKKVKQAPKLVKPGGKKPSVQRSRLAEAKGRLKKSGKVDDAASAIEQLI